VQRGHAEREQRQQGEGGWRLGLLGEDPERHPDRYEHFGITTVEAMSAGAVPVVIDAAGQVEIVEHGATGYRFAGLDDLVSHTGRLIADPAWRAALSAAAERRAHDFGWDAFTAAVHAEVSALG
jgi:glycosyltransferase involved in cell wall biosynthesis